MEILASISRVTLVEILASISRVTLVSTVFEWNLYWVDAVVKPIHREGTIFIKTSRIINCIVINRINIWKSKVLNMKISHFSLVPLLKFNQEFCWRQQFSPLRASKVLMLLWRFRWVIIPHSTPLAMSTRRKILFAGLSNTIRIFFLIELKIEDSVTPTPTFKRRTLELLEGFFHTTRILILFQLKIEVSLKGTITCERRRVVLL